MMRLTLLLTVACFGCSIEAAGPPSRDSDLAASLLLAAADPGNGAMVMRLTDETFLLPTADPQSGLFSAHYASATAFGEFPGCEVPPFEEIMDLQIVKLPKGKLKRLFSGTVYVRVTELAGFPFNVCDEPVAEGIVDIHGVDHLEAPDAFGTATGSFASNGVIRNNADGSDVRLHHTTKLKGSGGFPPQGTVRLR